MSLPTSQPTWAVESETRSGATGVHLKLTGLIFESSGFGKPIYSRDVAPIQSIARNLPLESVVPALNSLNDTKSVPLLIQCRVRGMISVVTRDHRCTAHGLTSEESSLDLRGFEAGYENSFVISESVLNDSHVVTVSL